jgi:putative ABC transport system permease protein
MLLLLLLVCANVAGVWIAGLLSRDRELSIRVAMGASAARLFREILSEAFVVSLIGAVGGILVGAWIAAAALPADIEPGVPYPALLLVLIFPIFLAVASAPAVLGRGRSPVGALRSGARVDGGNASSRLRRALVVFEMALASTLLLSAMLLLKSFRALETVDRGFRQENAYFASVELPFTRYREAHRRARFFEELQSRLRELPEVERASVSLGLPLDPRAEFFVTRSPYSVEGRNEPEPGRKPMAALHVVGPEFFETLGVPIRSGRGFELRDDREGAPVVIVNEAFANAAWPGEDPLGKELKHDLILLPDDAGTRRVVGVTSDFRYYALEREPEPSLYVPHGQSPWPSMHLLIRSSADPVSLHAQTRDILRSLDSDVPLPPLSPVSGLSERAVSEPRMRARLLTGFAAVAAFLASLGLYGVISLSVASRTREISLRVALGAGRRDVLDLVVGQALKLAFAGAFLGVLAAAFSARFLSSLLYGVGPFDPVSYAAMAGMLLLIALLASCLPAWRALAVDPASVLRGD